MSSMEDPDWVGENEYTTDTVGNRDSSYPGGIWSASAGGGDGCPGWDPSVMMIAGRSSGGFWGTCGMGMVPESGYEGGRDPAIDCCLS